MFSVLISAGAVAGFLLLRTSGANPRALEGTRGLIVGEVKRWDEREIVFAQEMSRDMIGPAPCASSTVESMHTCFDYWGKVGTDCNVCMRVCPWSHARTLPHRMIVWMVARNGAARRLFSRMDDIFYGERPRPKDPPAWASFGR
jgi:hypothetical protein